MTNVNLQLTARAMRQRWQVKGQWKEPDLLHAVAFLVTEAGEAMDEVLRQESAFVRNNPREADPEAIGYELADVVLMALVALDRLGMSLDVVLSEKLARMDDKRKGLNDEGN